MARSGILYSDVARAADKIKQSGSTPTVDNVRQMMGDTGSNSTIAPMLKKWKEEHLGEMTIINSGLPESILNAVRGVYELIKAESANAIDEIRSSCEQNLAEKEIQIKAISTTVNDLSNQRDHLEEESNRIKNTNNVLQLQLQQSHLELTALKNENQGLLNRLNDSIDQVKALHGQLDSARSQFEHFQEASKNQRLEEKQSYESRILQCESDLRHNKALQAGLQSENAQLHSENKQLRTTQDKMKEITQIQLQELSDLESLYNKTMFKLDETERNKNDVTSLLQDSQIKLQTIEIELAVSKNMQYSLEVQLQKAHEQNSSSEHEKLKLLSKLLQDHRLQPASGEAPSEKFSDEATE